MCKRTANITIPSVHELNVSEGNFARHHGHVVQLLSNSAVHLKSKKELDYEIIRIIKRYKLLIVGATNAYIFLYITVMYRNAKFVVFNFCALYIFSNLDEGSKNLYEITPSLVSFQFMKKGPWFSLNIRKRTRTSSTIGRNSLAG